MENMYFIVYSNKNIPKHIVYFTSCMSVYSVYIVIYLVEHCIINVRSVCHKTQLYISEVNGFRSLLHFAIYTFYML